MSLKNKEILGKYKNGKLMKWVMEEVENSTNPLKSIQTIIPDWVTCSFDEYSTDYPQLSKNWNRICEQIGTTPQKILLVECHIMDTLHLDMRDYTTLENLCNFLTGKGYCIRRANEFVKCSKCQRAIVSKDLWVYMKSQGVPCPEKWSPDCSAPDCSD
jgi:hypothetical protein